MRLTDICMELAEALSLIDGLRTYPYPPDTVNVPCAVVSYPESLDFNQTYGAMGYDMATIPIMVLVSRVGDRGASKEIEAYSSRKGERSVKEALETYTYLETDHVHVSGVSYDVYSVNEIDYLAATFLVQVLANEEEED